MEKLIKDVLRVLSQSGTREDLENSIQDTIKLHKDNSKNIDNSQKIAGQNIAFLKERLAQQKLLSRKTETKANNLLSMHKQKNDNLLKNYKDQMDQEKNTFPRKVESYEVRNKKLSDNLTNFPALQEELATIQGLLVSEKKEQQKLIDEKTRAEKELEKAKIKLEAQLPDDKNSITIKDSIKKIEKYKTENLILQKQVEQLNQKDKELTTDPGALNEEIIRFQNEIKDLQDRLGVSEVEKEELNKFSENERFLSCDIVNDADRLKVLHSLKDKGFIRFKGNQDNLQFFELVK